MAEKITYRSALPSQKEAVAKDKNKFACSHIDLNKIIDALKINGYFINEGEAGEIYVLKDKGPAWTEEKAREVIFRAVPTGRHQGEVWYKATFTPDFDNMMNGKGE